MKVIEWAVGWSEGAFDAKRRSIYTCITNSQESLSSRDDPHIVDLGYIYFILTIISVIICSGPHAESGNTLLSSRI